MELYQQIFFSTLAASFGLLHLLLYLYNRRFRSNLFFSLFLFLYALNIFFDYQSSMAGTSPQGLFYLRMHRLVMPYNFPFALLFLYYAFGVRIPRYFWGIIGLTALTGFMAVLHPVANFVYVQVPMILAILEAGRILIVAMRRHKRDAWILTTGFIFLFLFSSYDILMDFGVIRAVDGINNGYPFGFLLLIVCSSIYLARDFARVNRTLLQQEREAREMEVARKVLEAEDRRKALELQEAREVQLSMLPRDITEIGEYECCFTMRPASEVGGDYYDYRISDQNDLTLVIGDATGHGMKAGIMVSIMKSLFLSQKVDGELSAFLNRSSRIVRQLKLKNLFMALMPVRIRNRRLSVTSAGIPPLLIHRRESGSIEELLIKGMPLEAVESFPYQVRETELGNGDTVLMMTDGLIELFNNEREAFGLDRLKDLFSRIADRPVHEIVDMLTQAADDWLGDKSQDDDMTFVCFRLKE